MNTVLRCVGKLALSLLCLAVIIGPTVLMVLTTKPDPCTSGKPVKLILYPRQA